jgi:hypothetical protein
MASPKHYIYIATNGSRDYSEFQASVLVAFMLQEYKADKNPQKTVNLLKAVQWTQAAWESAVTKDRIKRCWVKLTLIKKPEDSAEDSTEDTIIVDNRTDCVDLQNQIAQLPIKNPLPLDKFLNPEDKTILDEEDNIFEAIVAAYSSNQANEEGESSDEEEVKEVEDDTALRAIETVKLWKLQKGTDHDIKVLDQIEGDCTI